MSSSNLALNDRPPRVCLTRRIRTYGLDVADPRFNHPRYWMRDDITSVLRLEGQDPDTLKPSAIGELTLHDLGEYTGIGAEIKKQFLGFLCGAGVREFARLAVLGIDDPAAVWEAKLSEGDGADEQKVLPNGGVIHFEGGAEPWLEVCFGRHCFGRASGAPVREFLHRALSMASFGISTDPRTGEVARNVYCISDRSRRQEPVPA